MVVLDCQGRGAWGTNTKKCVQKDSQGVKLELVVEGKWMSQIQGDALIKMITTYPWHSVFLDNKDDLVPRGFK